MFSGDAVDGLLESGETTPARGTEAMAYQVVDRPHNPKLGGSRPAHSKQVGRSVGRKILTRTSTGSDRPKPHKELHPRALMLWPMGLSKHLITRWFRVRGQAGTLQCAFHTIVKKHQGILSPSSLSVGLLI